MAAGDIVYGSRTALANVARLDSDANGVGTAFGEVDNTAEKAEDYIIHLKFPINSSATTGSYDIYMVESQDGTEWTDGIDPSGSDSDFVDFVKDAVPIDRCSTVYDNSPTGAHTSVEMHFRVCDYVSVPAPYFGFVRINRSGQSAPSSGADGDYMSIKRAPS